MRIETDSNGVTLIREPGDKRLGKESTVTFWIRNLLNARDGRTAKERKRARQGYGAQGRAGEWRRFYPDRVGLTGCRQGVWNGRQGAGAVAYWHERYAVEDAAEEFNRRGRVWFQRVEGE